MARRMWQEEEEADNVEAQQGIDVQESEPIPQECTGDYTQVIRTSSREELIESIKRGESPEWIPNQALQALLAKENQASFSQQEGTLQQPEFEELKKPLHLTQPGPPSLHLSSLKSPEEAGRPRSALHSGDFREKYTQQGKQDASRAPSSPLGGSFDVPTSPFSALWDTPKRMAPLARFHSDFSASDTHQKENSGRTRAPSLGSSLSSSFVLRTPTSPLVYSTSNVEPESIIQDQPLPPNAIIDKTNRRRTLPPESFSSIQTSPGSIQTPNFSRPLPTVRKETSAPQPTHQPRRSLTSFTYQPLSTPQTPTFLRSRRPSMSSDISPSQHASMVGSFEESILRGRMSTAPSKPLDFVAQIGVLGKGNCKPSLRCPAHVTVPFPAVFYSYPSTGNIRSFADDSPSPYVGNIDLEHSLKPVELRKHGRRHLSRSQSPDKSQLDITAPENTSIGRALAREQRQRRRRSLSPKLSLGGCYRVPQEGQLQIVIKNPNKTAVKLYLIPYNLEGMEVGTKTFVRQRSFSAGPVIEDALSDKLHPTPISDPLKDKHVLRYLIHLKFCCPAKGRFYLYDNVRVVFANRVPDGKEKLRNEIQLPEPRYSPYKAGRDHTMATASARAAARRPSFGFGLTSNNIDAMDGIVFASSPDVVPQPRLPPSSAIPFHFDAGFRKALAKSEPGPNGFQMEAPTRPTEFHDRAAPDQMQQDSSREQTLSPVPGFLPSTSARGSPLPWSMDSGTSSVRSFSPAPVESGGGLLARKLRDLQTQNGTSALQD